MRDLIKQTELEELIRRNVFLKISEAEDNEQISTYCNDLADTILMVLEKYVSEEIGSNEVKILYKSMKREAYIKFSELTSEKELNETIDDIFSQIKRDVNQYVGAELL